MYVTAIDYDAVSIPAYTCNISQTGVLFQSSREFRVGQYLEYVVDLYPDRSVQLKCRGRVVRGALRSPDALESHEGHVFAAALEELECIHTTSRRQRGLAEQYA
jgi:hypothetical protein